jgi:TolB protein
MIIWEYIWSLNMHLKNTTGHGYRGQPPHTRLRRKGLQIVAQIMFPLLLLVTHSAWLGAQSSSSLDITGKIRTGEFKPYQIAVGDFKVVGTPSPAADSLAAAIKKVITDDLDFHIFFDTVSVKKFYLDVWEIKELTPEAWQRMGADYLMEGTVELTSDEVKVEYKLSELTPKTRELASQKLKTKPSNWRTVAHVIADLPVKQIAGEKPFFTSRIAFISAKSGNKEIYVCDYDGANAVQITNDQSINLSPCWDRKQDKLLYTTYKHWKPQVWEIDLHSKIETPIAAFKGSNSAPSVSPDNDEVVVSLTKDDNSELYVVSRKGEIKRRLTDTPAIEVGASWAPTGNEIVFASDRSGAPQIYMMDAEGFNVTRLTYDGKYNDSPDLSPRGDAIVYVARGDDGNFQICTINVRGQDFQQLDQTGSNENPHWAPDGWHVVFCKHERGKDDLYIMDRFKKKIKKITNDGKSSNPAWQPFVN